MNVRRFLAFYGRTQVQAMSPAWRADDQGQLCHVRACHAASVSRKRVRLGWLAGIRSSARLILDPRLICNPVDLPGFAPIIRERLLKVR